MSVAPAVGEAVLTVGYQVARYAPHVVHLPQAAHRVLDEEEAGAERADDAERVAVHLVGPCGLDLRSSLLTLGILEASFRLLSLTRSLLRLR